MRLGDRLLFVDHDPPEPATVVDIEMKDKVIVGVLLQTPVSTRRVTAAELVDEAVLVLDTPSSISAASSGSRDIASKAFRASLQASPPGLVSFSVTGAWVGDRLLFIDRDPAEPATIVDVLLADGSITGFLLETASGLSEVTADDLTNRRALSLDRDEQPH